MFESFRTFETTLAGRPFVVEVGKMAGLANGSCLVRYGDTVVLCTATMADSPREGIDFFPLSVDFEEKLYAVGKIPGSFLKREGRPSEKAILASRVIDRPMRPLFPKDMRNDVCIVCTVMSVDMDNSPEIAAMNGASIAVAISDIPWNGPIAGMAVGLVDGQVVMNPTLEQRQKSDLSLTVASTHDKVAMIEAGANEVSDDVMYDAIMKAHEQNVAMVDFINGMVREVGKPKREFPSQALDPDFLASVEEFATEQVRWALFDDDKTVRDARMAQVTEKTKEHFATVDESCLPLIDEALYQTQKHVVRRALLDEGKRVDGRGLHDLRPLAAEVGLLPRVHGSGMFTRGQTQVLTVATLGTMREAQLLDGIDNEEYKRYMHHYNFPSYSVGEARPPRSPGRREIGHGALAERALLPVIPSEEEFPYTIRLVSEVLSSNGSTSQGSVCGSTLALMDAGVPIKAPVAGISCGLVTEGERWMTFVDIQGIEDFFGDMDFKVAGTHKGITAIQMDLKIDGLTGPIIKSALELTHTARDYILDEVMLKAIEAPRPELSKYAPKMIRTIIDEDKIREVIGPGGKVIQRIVAETGCKIDIEDDGSVFIAAADADAGARALAMIEAIAKDPEIGSVFTGRVTRIMNFGAFVEIAPGKEGLVHISKLDHKRVEKVEDVVSVGDEIKVKVIEIDEKGRINLSRKDCLPKPAPAQGFGTK
ncbi:MAG TPA: polyribonucleotide nucleotidyltransferase [Candidatus Galloscillospira excrementipullorum]|nr:polyribonucleotide nucleotidyltransferase [Candidatus Galloscillospira excrementipullorum]